MILPGSYTATLAILILGLLCWSAWANTFKAAGPRWRFELFYIDFATGMLIAALIASFTLGSLGWDGFSLVDDLRLAGKRKELFAFVAGAIFNLANMLLVAAVSIAGLAIGFPIVMGIALFIGAILSYGSNPQGSLPLLGAGCAVTAASVIFAILAWRGTSASILAVPVDPGAKKARKKAIWYKAIVLAIIGGALMGCFPRLVDMARSDGNGLGPYALATVFTVGVFMSTMIYNLFFMNLPVSGKPVEFRQYLRGTGRQHLLGMLGGALWIVGLLTGLVANRADGAANAGKPAMFALGQAPTLVVALCGIVFWRELEISDANGRTFLGITLFLFVLGVVMFSVAPLYGGV